MFYLYIFTATFALSILCTLVIKKLAWRLRILDEPKGDRKLHAKPTPLLGGVAIFFAFFVCLFFVRDLLLAGDLEAMHWIGFFAGGLFLMIGGYLDDRHNLSPGRQLIFPVLAVLSVVIGGVEIEKITNPFGGFFYLDKYQIQLFTLFGFKFTFIIISDIVVSVWLLGMMYTTKLLDGVDGLVSGVTGVGALITFLFTMTTKYFQPDIGLAALILSAACFGFLVLNWHPAKIFLGEGGSLFLGFALGVLAIISGGKIAITLLIMGIPILDLFWTIFRRLAEGKNPFKISDRKHLHFRLQDIGLSPRQTSATYYLFALIFGLSAVFMQSKGKIFALGILVIIMLGIIAVFSRADRKNKTL
ncbi:MAG: UDP-GlcNAc:undecaprenyl-P GlcNAc 1-P transferase TagO [Candidatus Falkowbacteria bacterium GW2011_GWC2_38_22]|uniref:UDP-GlcNAc:undecaprenyl-P GlcNAc 1-P transferase TagO n=1 Tax=Candidatus Falkowbacteria bacterium GW2011_GWE1_38_31 TaxID=1618638 RepID=A0A0G0JPW2_9BACT|nr:MAG: UDP-GlcNAc:undecaprenyl-P GlcNAc 1-P transferase TagO [Candidatus Falkowbacteria bacterium GW2011_GWF2_38_1205]KKQ60530.1 MAG: UDP-GlcNAc:undecaprenyl-P GlcNAc 1-P transferase TagO [Candidatus Falkowbacteria bacterium GW2011_GWC2_38_22]KKQ62649.1 MAG: UDP-GlcNAc:undecaprenyl-P GlcNAc 1-P transferase TagO [Candidatus Falkowbacteria bacterium GW2011_GWF1_38_22]KKQ64709.1 MAG: UDP-GlcNAc:undecaprenyl-P GlcNAc 1-P transferase TagO [Candidatus Falkowbacteria bacterium GW2011_GWE2_38_254]KKQ6